MTSRHPGTRGTTLVELMVVLTIFVSMLAIIMSFYVEAQQANKKHEKVSEEYRAAMQATMRIESLLQYARVYEVRKDQVVYAAPKVDQGMPTIKGRWPLYESTTSTLWIDNPTCRLMLRDNTTGLSVLLMRLWTGQQLTFSGGASTVALTIQGNPATTMKRNVFSLTHQVHIENPGTL